MLTRCDDSYEAEFNLLREHFRLRLHLALAGDLYQDVVNLWDTDLPGKVRLKVFVKFWGFTCQLEHAVTERRNDLFE